MLNPNLNGQWVLDIYTPLRDRKELFPDTVHPDDDGARRMAAAVYQALTDHAPHAVEE